MIIDINTIKLVFGFARIGAPDPDSLNVVDETAHAVLALLKALQEESSKAQAANQIKETPLTEEKLISSLNGVS